jgi:hypothetical protein
LLKISGFYSSGDTHRLSALLLKPSFHERRFLVVSRSRNVLHVLAKVVLRTATYPGRSFVLVCVPKNRWKIIAHGSATTS